MTVTGLEVLTYTLLFIVPGFIINSIFWRFVEEDEQPQHILFLRFLTFSSLNVAVWSPVILWSIRNDWWLSNPAFALIIWISMMVVSPSLLGVFLGVAEQRGWLGKLLKSWRLRICSVDKPSAWESFLWNLEDPVYVLITLDDNSEIAGYIGSNSLITSRERGGDIYVEELYKVDNEKWIPVQGSRGIWIKGSSIKHAEFKS